MTKLEYAQLCATIAAGIEANPGVEWNPGTVASRASEIVDAIMVVTDEIFADALAEEPAPVETSLPGAGE